MPRATVHPMVPNSSADAPALLTSPAALMLTMLIAIATTIATTASSATSQCVGSAHRSGANTDASATEMPAEPTSVSTRSTAP